MVLETLDLALERCVLLLESGNAVLEGVVLVNSERNRNDNRSD